MLREEIKAELSPFGFSQTVGPRLRKRALIIGNNDYSESTKLESLNLCINDANLIGESLRKIGFDEVIIEENLTNKKITYAIADFKSSQKENDLVFFYYAGHGAQKNNEVYLYGTDSKEEIQGDISSLKGIALNKYLMQTLLDNCFFIFVLDACRRNPSTVKERSLSGGGIILDQATGMTIQPIMSQYIREFKNIDGIGLQQYEIIYACQPDRPTYEPQNVDRSYLASALSECIVMPENWSDVVINTKRMVYQLSGGQQLPQSLSNLTYQIRLVEKKISGTVLKRCFENETLSNQQFIVKEKSDIEITVKKRTVVRDLELENLETESCKYLQINVSGDHQIIFDNCTFKKIGLYICKAGGGYGTNDTPHITPNKCTVQIRDCTIQDAPFIGLYLQHIGYFIVKDTEISNCEMHGCVFEDCGENSQLKDCQIRNCKKYGVSLYNCEIDINRQSVTFENNLGGEVMGGDTGFDDDDDDGNDYMSIDNSSDSSSNNNFDFCLD